MKNLKYFVISLILLASQIISAQKTSANKSNLVDSMLNNAQHYLENLKQNNKLNFVDNTVTLQQYKILNKIAEKTDLGNSILREGFDSLGIQKELEGIAKWNEMASDGIFEKDVNFIMSANLYISTIILRELLTRTEVILDKLKSPRKKIEEIRIGIDSLTTLDVLYKTPKDTSKVKSYLAKIMKTQSEASHLIDQTNKMLSKIQELESLGSILKIDLESKIVKTEQLRMKRLKGKNGKDFENFSTHKYETKSFVEIIKYSSNKIFLALVFYIFNHIELIIVLILFVIGMVFYLKTLRKHLNFIVSKNSISEYYVLKYPAFTAIVVVTNVFQFFFSNPPFLFYAGMWLITLGFLVYLLKFSIDVIWQRWVLMLSILYFIVYFDNMILLPHFADKIFVLILSVLSIALGIAGLFNLKKSNDKVMFLKWFLWIFIFFESLSLLSNLFDDFNASKRAMIAGVMEMVMIVLMVWTLKVLYKVFYLSLEVYKKSDDNNFTINLERFNKNMPKYYFALAIVGWIYMFVNFFYVIHIIIQPIIAFFTEERQIGNFVFTFDHIILFVTIILISTVISKILSYLLADSFVIKESAKNKKSINLGSWVLLLRIAIISIGLMIAFVSAGIPFDRITIIISALSVGIGFGMQTLVNNLVSGLILAFEKPINVGDVVELAGQTGRMKSIGFRSSMITTWDGSDVIIPNGDLLNQHLINWTLGNSQARFNIVVGIAYGTDLEQVHQLAIDLLNNQKDVLKYPQPLVVFKEFAGSSIDMDIKFWVADYSTGVIIRSQLIVAIDKLFKENNIVIPFPQQDVYIKSIAKENEEK